MSSDSMGKQAEGAIAVASDNLPAVSPDQRALIQEALGGSGLPVLHNFQGDKLEVWRQATRATGPDVSSVGDHLGERIPIKWFYVHRVSILNDQTGEYSTPCRVVFVTPDKRQFACVSDQVARDLFGVIQCFGMGPYDPAIDVQVVEVKTRKGFRCYRVVPVE